MVRKIIRLLHINIGLLSGLVVFIVAVTGSLYAFEEEFRRMLYRDMMLVQEGPSVHNLNDVIEVVKKTYPAEKIRNVRVHGPTESIEVFCKSKLSVFVDPFAGKVVGAVNMDEDFFGVVEKMHRTLFLGDTGKVITGVSAIIFVFMLITGIVVWWPKSRSSLRRKLTLTPAPTFYRKVYDLHSVLGFYASWIIIFTALTGIVFAFKWAENGLFRLTGSTKFDQKSIRSVGVPDTAAGSIGAIFEKVKKTSTFTECVLVMPDGREGAVRVMVRYDNSGFFRKQHVFFYDQYNGSLLHANLFENTSMGEKLRVVNYDIHTGKAWGVPGQLLVFFAALISASLPVTGLLMWLQRRKSG